ncbi:MAG: phage integrase N-terminal SAM-like domain-containing protein [Ignavibacteriaceae bacterium]
MHTQINIPTKSESGMLPQQGYTNTFQKDKSRLLDRVSIDMPVKHYSRKTEESYTSWMKRFILFNNKKHPNEMGIEEIQKISYTREHNTESDKASCTKG